MSYIIPLEYLRALLPDRFTWRQITPSTWSIANFLCTNNNSTTKRVLINKPKQIERRKALVTKTLLSVQREREIHRDYYGGSCGQIGCCYSLDDTLAWSRQRPVIHRLVAYKPYFLAKLGSNFADMHHYNYLLLIQETSF